LGEALVQLLKHVVAFSDRETKTRCIAFPIANPTTVYRTNKLQNADPFGR